MTEHNIVICPKSIPNIVICPKSIPKIESCYEGEYFVYFLKENRIKTIVTNECWSAFKYRITKKFLERFEREVAEKKAEERIAKYRDWIKPEHILLDKNGRDIVPVIDYGEQELIEKTKDLLKRQGQMVKYFICEHQELYANINDKQTLEEFFNTSIQDVDTNRSIIVQDFVNKYPQARDEEMM